MSGDERKSSGEQRPSDLVCQGTSIWLWCLPTLALVAGANWNAARAWLWIPALLIMGAGCLVNARRCGRTHCFVTGPLFVLAALYVALAELGVVPLRPSTFLSVVLGITALAFLAELPMGRYILRR